MPNDKEKLSERFVWSLEDVEIVNRPDDDTKEKKQIRAIKGGPGSGHHGHRGRPGKVGGSLPDGGGVNFHSLERMIGNPKTSVEDVEREIEEEWEGVRGGMASTSLLSGAGNMFFYDGGELIGILSFIPEVKAEGNTLHIDTLATKRSGYGEAVMQHVAFVAKNNNYQKVVILGAASSHGFYEAIGMRKEGSVFTWTESDMDDIISKIGVEEESKQVKARLILKGGPGSGHFGHRGRPGKVGGSLPDGIIDYKPHSPLWLLDRAVNGPREGDPSPIMFDDPYVPGSWSQPREYSDYFHPDVHPLQKKVLAEMFGVDEINEKTAKSILKDIESFTTLPGFKGNVSLGINSSRDMTLEVEWDLITPGSIRGISWDLPHGVLWLRRTSSGDRYIKWESLTFPEELQNRDYVTDVYGKAISAFVNWDMDRIETMAAMDIGKYAWAKKGFDYELDHKAPHMRRKMARWVESNAFDMSHGIDPRDIPDFNSAYEVATYDPGPKLRGFNIDNGSVPNDMELHVGKAFMLDDELNGGHGGWSAVFDLTRFRQEE